MKDHFLNMLNSPNIISKTAKKAATTIRILQLKNQHTTPTQEFHTWRFLICFPNIFVLKRNEKKWWKTSMWTEKGSTLSEFDPAEISHIDYVCTFFNFDFS